MLGEKVATIIESYFTKKTTEAADIEEDVSEDGENIVEATTDVMAQYLSAIQKANK